MFIAAKKKSQVVLCPVMSMGWGWQHPACFQKYSAEEEPCSILCNRLAGPGSVSLLNVGWENVVVAKMLLFGC